MKRDSKSSGVSYHDFTESHYREILELVNDAGRPSVSYESIPWSGEYLLWRHDIDLSINRSVKLAEINAEYSVHSTFFVNIHSTFYNPFELAQARMLREIISMGHDIGVHFDGAFYGQTNELELERFIAKEANLLAELTGKPPVAVSFHNPTERMLAVDSPRLGGLVNAYSQKLMTEAKYCSDSNGYWRYDRLADVVADSTVERLQVLTHPGWWLERPMAPRQRIHRAAYGRAVAVMDDYDRTLSDFSRQNVGAWENILGTEQAAEFDIPPLWHQLLSEEKYDLFFFEIWQSFLRVVDGVATGGLRRLAGSQLEDRSALAEGLVVIRARREAFLEEFRKDLTGNDENLDRPWQHLGDLAEQLVDLGEPVTQTEILSSSSIVLSLFFKLRHLLLQSGFSTTAHSAFSPEDFSSIAGAFFEESTKALETHSVGTLNDTTRWTAIANSLDFP